MSAGPLAAIHETNMAMMRAAADTFIPGGAKRSAQPRGSTPPVEAAGPQTEIEALKEQMAAMQKKLDELSK